MSLKYCYWENWYADMNKLLHWVLKYNPKQTPEYTLLKTCFLKRKTSSESFFDLNEPTEMVSVKTESNLQLFLLLLVVSHFLHTLSRSIFFLYKKWQLLLNIFWKTLFWEEAPEKNPLFSVFRVLEVSYQLKEHSIIIIAKIVHNEKCVCSRCLNKKKSVAGLLISK